MTGRSLGLRLSGSFSSLEHQLDNGGLHHQIPYLGRRQSKTSLPIYREKDRFHTYAFRYLCRKKVGVLFLVGFALVAFMTGFLTVNKEDDMEFDYRYINKVSVCDVPGWNIFLNASVVAETYRDTTVLTPHPFKNVAPPPPPPGVVQGIGPRPCPVCYLPVEEAIARISRVTPPSPILQHLTYLSEDNPLRTERYGGSDFGGYPSLKQRTDSLRIEESTAVHCGDEIFVFSHGKDHASKLWGSTPHDQLLIRTSDSFSGVLLFAIGFLFFMVAFVKDREFHSFFARGCVLFHVAMAIWRIYFERKVEDLGHDLLRLVVGDIVLGLSWVFFLVYSWREKYD